VYLIAWERAYGSDKYNRIEQEDTNGPHVTLQDTEKLCPAFFQGLSWMLEGKHRTDYAWSMIPKHYPDSLWEEDYIAPDDFFGGLPMYEDQTYFLELLSATPARDDWPMRRRMDGKSFSFLIWNFQKKN